MTGVEAARRLIASPVLRRVARGCRTDVFLTGGSLRDRLLSLATHDLDLVVADNPHDTAHRLAAEFGGSCFPLGKPPFVTWRVITPTLQADLWQPEGSVEGDILRRDFTINAIFWRLPNGPLLDLVGGLDDLAAGRVRVVSETNLHADPLRILRAFRLISTRPSLRLTADSETQLARVAPRLTTVARERVVSELSLLLEGPAVGRALASAWRLGVLVPVVPGWTHTSDLHPVLEVASRLGARVRSGSGLLRRDLSSALPAVLAAPAAGFPNTWDESAAAAALVHAGWPSRTARRVARAAGTGRKFGELRDLGDSAARELAMEAGADLHLALGWYLATASRPDGAAEHAAGILLRWARRMVRRSPLLSGDEVATILDLPPGPARARAVNLLKREQARGTLRGPRQAASWLRDRWRASDGER